jgi:hypothetical protein
MEKEIGKLAPADVPGFQRFLKANRTKLKYMEPYLESPFLGWKDLFRWHLPGRRWHAPRKRFACHI